MQNAENMSRQHDWILDNLIEMAGTDNWPRLQQMVEEGARRLVLLAQPARVDQNSQDYKDKAFHIYTISLKTGRGDEAAKKRKLQQAACRGRIEKFAENVTTISIGEYSTDIVV